MTFVIEDEMPEPRYTLSPDLVVRLIEQQRQVAKELQEACEVVAVKRQELADIEAVVRVVTGRGT